MNINPIAIMITAFTMFSKNHVFPHAMETLLSHIEPKVITINI